MESIPPSTQFGANMTLLEAWQQVLSRALYSSPPVSAFPPVASSRPSASLNASFLAGVKPALAAATIVSASAGIWSWVKTRV